MHGDDMTKRQAIIVDIDGTVALRGGRSPYDWHRVLEDEPNRPVLTVVMAMQVLGYRTVFLSGRMEQCRADTALWLQRNGLVQDHTDPMACLFGWDLFMRADGDMRPDDLVKDQIFQEHIEPYFDVLCVFDDRDKVVKMWREKHKLTVLQVAPGDF